MRDIQQKFGRERTLAIERSLWGRCGDDGGMLRGRLRTVLGRCGDFVSVFW